MLSWVIFESNIAAASFLAKIMGVNVAVPSNEVIVKSLIIDVLVLSVLGDSVNWVFQITFEIWYASLFAKNSSNPHFN